MQREIKFRAWHSRHKKWLHTTDQACNILGEMILLGGWCKVPIEELKDVVVMQYTGLKDSNGVEIYEGDVVQCEGHSWEDNFRAEVIFRDGAFQDSRWYRTLHASPKITVLGNIYEYPELLEEK